MRPSGALLLFGLLLAACGGGAGDAVPEDGPAPARDLILVTVDTWRADHFDAERAGVPLTPGLSDFADGGVRFTNAHSVASETSPGTAGFLTGLIPRRSGVLINPHILSEGVPTMATIVKDAGFATAAVVANPVLRPGLGFDQGFDSYELVPRNDLPKARASAVTDAALAAFDALPAGEDGRRFLWVHYLDPHGPYVPPAGVRERFPIERFEAPRDIPFNDDQSTLGGIPRYQRHGLDEPSHDGRDYMARYAAEVRDMDGEVARLFEGLAERGVLDTAVVAITSDHGEALAGDHGHFFGHNTGLTQDQIHVPLVIRCPGCPAGTTESRPVSNADVLPTVLARLGVALPEGPAMDGLDLFRPGSEATIEEIERGGKKPRIVFSQRSRLITVRLGDWKLHWQHGHDPALYDLAADPGEARDVSADHPERTRELLERLHRYLRREVLARPESRRTQSDKERDDLRTLGYL